MRQIIKNYFILVIMSMISVSLLLTSMYFIKPLEGYFPPTLGNLLTGIATLMVAIYFNKKINSRQNIEYKGSLALNVNIENVYSLTNTGKTPVKIISIKFAQEDEYKREQSDLKLIYNSIEKLSKTLQPIELNKDMSLGCGEMIAIPHVSVAKPIEEIEFAMQVLEIIYIDGNKRIMSKKFTICWLTSPEEFFNHKIRKELKDKLKKHPEYGKKNNAEILMDPIMVNLDGFFDDLFVDNEYQAISAELLEKYKKMKNFNNLIPQNNWYIIRIEEKDI